MASKENLQWQKLLSFNLMWTKKKSVNESSIIKYTWKAVDINENNFSKMEIKMEKYY